MGSHRQPPSLCPLKRKKWTEHLPPQNRPMSLSIAIPNLLVKLRLRNFPASVFMQRRPSCDPTSFWTWQMNWFGIKASSFLLTLADSKVLVKICGPQTVWWRSSWSCFGHPPGEEHHWHKRRRGRASRIFTSSSIQQAMGGSAILPSWQKLIPAGESWDFTPRKLPQLSSFAGTTWPHLRTESACTFFCKPPFY